MGTTSKIGDCNPSYGSQPYQQVVVGWIWPGKDELFMKICYSKNLNKKTFIAFLIGE